MNISEAAEDVLVRDDEKLEYGIGKIEEISNGLVYVWYDEVETRVHYNEEELKILKPLEV